MASELAFVGVPLGDDRPPPRPRHEKKAYMQLLALVGVVSVIFFCQSFLVDTPATNHPPELNEYEETAQDISSLVSEKVPLTDGDTGSNDEIVVLTDETFDKVLREHDAVFVDFYAPWCVWCQRLVPTWTKFASAASQLPVVVGKVDCVEHAELCRQERVMAFPTLRWYSHGKATSPDYKMDRTVSKLVSFAKTMLNDEDDSMPLPAYVVDDKENYSYVGEISSQEDDDASEMLDFKSKEEEDLEAFSDDEPVAEQSMEESDEMEGPDMFTNEPASVRLTQEAFAHNLQPMFVNFYAPWCIHSFNLAPIWEKFVLEVSDLPVMIRKVDCVDDAELCACKHIVKYPTLRWYNGNDETIDYEPHEITVPSLVEFVKDRLNGIEYKDEGRESAFHQSSSEDEPDTPSVARSMDESNSPIFEGTHSIALTDRSFDHFLEENERVFVNFFAPWCEWSQRLAPVWKDFALEMRLDEAIEIAHVDCVAFSDLCRKHHIFAFPTLRMYHQGEATSSDYKMDRTVESLVSFARRHMDDGSIREEDAIDDNESKLSSTGSRPIGEEEQESTGHEYDFQEEEAAVKVPRWMATLW